MPQINGNIKVCRVAIFFLQKIIRPSADLRNHNSEISRQCKEENEAVIITVNGSSFTSRCPLKVVETNGCPTAQMKEKCGSGKLRIDSAVLESDPKLKSKKECSGRKRIIRKFV